MTQIEERTGIINSLVETYQERCREILSDDLEAFYLFGSLAFNKISIEMPDINFFLLVKEGARPDIFLKHADILREIIDEFKDRARIIVEFRPNRYIHCRGKDVGFDIFLNPQYARMEDRHGDVPFGWGWIFESLLKTKKFVFGNDALAEVVQPPLTVDYMKKYFPGTYSHLWLPLERAPLQYTLPDDNFIFMHEAYKVAQMSAIGFGVNLALNEEELREEKWMDFVYDKHKLIPFYRERYDEATAQNVVLTMEVRDNWLKYRDDPEMGIKMYRAAISLCSRLKAKYVELVTS